MFELHRKSRLFTAKSRLLPRTACITVATVVAALIAAPAYAAQVGSNATYDRPGIAVNFHGSYNIDWAGTDANGEINAETTDSSGANSSGDKWTDASSATYPGTGTTIDEAANYPAAIVAWTDLNATVHVGVDFAGVKCESTDFGSSVDTPYLTNSGSTIYLITVDSGGYMHVATVTDTGCAIAAGQWGGANTLAPGGSVTLSGNTTYVGPAMFSTYANGSSRFWLVWAGTNSAHNINIGQFTPGSSTLTNKIVESTHSTITDMGATTTSTGTGYFTYCGTNNVVYGQAFTGTTQSETTLGGSCAIYTGSSGYINGGVDVGYDSGQLVYVYANKSNYALEIGTHSAP